jgi:hypothetical protein
VRGDTRVRVSRVLPGGCQFRPAPDLSQRDPDRPGVQLTLSRMLLPVRRAQATQPGRRLLVQVLCR